MNNRLQTLRQKLNDAIKNQQYTKACKIQQQIGIEMRRKEHVPLSTILPGMTQQQTEEALCKMHKLFITADLLYGFAIDFENNIRKYDPSMETHVVRKVKEIASIAREITKNVDDFHCDEMSENFGNMCDEAGLVLENIIYKYRQRDLNRKKNELTKQEL